MNAGRLVIVINGREALPVRAIPYVTSWHEAPDAIVHALAAPKSTRLPNGREVRNMHNDLFAFQMDAQGSYVQIPPAQWEQLAVTLDSLTTRLKADERDGAEDENWAAWRIAAVLELPDNCFVWLYEFQQWYSRTRPMLMPNHGNELWEREDDDLCLGPIIPPEIEGRLWRYHERSTAFPPPGQVDSSVAQPSPKAEQNDGKPLPQHRHQEKEILRVIGESGYAATALPKNEKGKPGVKAEVRRKLNFSVLIFDKAWERLRASKEIVDAL